MDDPMFAAEDADYVAMCGPSSTNSEYCMSRQSMGHKRHITGWLEEDDVEPSPFIAYDANAIGSSQVDTVPAAMFEFPTLGTADSMLNVYALIFLASLLLFFNASRLVRSAATFYAGSAVVGVFSSLIVVAFVLQKLLPRRALAFPLYLGGWPLSFYVYYKAWQNFGLLVLNYQLYLAIYVGVVALISFAFCYRFGPPTDVRTLNLIKWSLQLAALVGIYFSCSNYQPMAFTLIFFLVTWPLWKLIYATSSKIFRSFNLWLRHVLFGPTPRRLMTEAEFEAEAQLYTNRELEKLRKSCRESPSQRSWRVISRLSDPRRMASFINGDSDHVTADESGAHASEIWPDVSSDEEEEFVPSLPPLQRRSSKFLASPGASTSLFASDTPPTNHCQQQKVSSFVSPTTKSPSFTNYRQPTTTTIADAGDFITDDDED